MRVSQTVIKIVILKAEYIITIKQQYLLQRFY
jgi:hypothetical protein